MRVTDAHPLRVWLFVCGVLAAPICAHAQTPPANPPRAIAQNLINLPTTQPLQQFGHHFRITHRFARDLRRGTFAELAEDLFGLDNGAVIGLDYRFAPTDAVQVGIYRSMLQRTIQLSGRVDAWRNGERPVDLSLVLSVEGTNNMRDDHAPGLGFVVSRTAGPRLALYAMPMVVWNTAAAHEVDVVDDDHGHDHGLSTPAPFDDGKRNTGFIGLAARLRVTSGTALVGEFSPRVAGHSPPGRGVWGVAIEKQTRGHLFQINLTNSFGTTYGQTALGGERTNIYLGFNLARRW
jgi:hypothetical protein